jgi:hypothetical protein
MTISREDLAAYADGELEEARRKEVDIAIKADPALAAEVEAHRKLKRTLSAHFAPIAEAPVPGRFSNLLRLTDPPQLADFAAAHGKREARRKRSNVRWGWIAGPALAASLALVAFLPRAGEAPEGYAETQLALVLDRQLVGTQRFDADTRILLSFRNREGQYCRAYTGEAQSGIACRDSEGWRLRTTDDGATAQPGEYRMAGAAPADILAVAQDMAVGPALTAEEEEAARDHEWRSAP